MQVRTADSIADRRRFVDFVYEVYGGNACFRDTQVHAPRAFLFGKDCFARACRVRPLQVVDDGRSVQEVLCL